MTRWLARHLFYLVLVGDENREGVGMSWEEEVC